MAKVESEPFDVVLSDMRMPNTDGATLRANVKRPQPQAVRMLLTGQTEQESVLNMLGLWGLPYPVTEAVAYHREARMLHHSSPQLADAIYLAHSLASEVAGEPIVPELDLAYLSKLGLGIAKIERMREISRELVSKAPATRGDGGQ